MWLSGRHEGKREAESNWKARYVHGSSNGPFSRKWALKFSSRQESRAGLLINEDWNRSNGPWDNKLFSSRAILRYSLSLETNRTSDFSYPTEWDKYETNFCSSNCDHSKVFTFFHRLRDSNDLSIGGASCTNSIVRVVRYYSKYVSSKNSFRFLSFREEHLIDGRKPYLAGRAYKISIWPLLLPGSFGKTYHFFFFFFLARIQLMGVNTRTT